MKTKIAVFVLITTAGYLLAAFDDSSLEGISEDVTAMVAVGYGVLAAALLMIIGLKFIRKVTEVSTSELNDGNGGW